jgi:hypothetical protein
MFESGYVLFPLFLSANVSPPARTSRRLPSSRCCEELTPEEMDPQVPQSGDAQKPLVDGYEGRRLRNGVGGKVVQLHVIVVAQPPHEPAG